MWCCRAVLIRRDFSRLYLCETIFHMLLRAILNRRATCIALLTLSIISTYVLVYGTEGNWKVLTKAKFRVPQFEKRYDAWFSTSPLVEHESEETTTILSDTTVALSKSKVHKSQVHKFHPVDVVPYNLPTQKIDKATRVSALNLNKTVKVFMHEKSVIVNKHEKEPVKTPNTNETKMTKNTKMQYPSHGMYIYPRRYSIDKIGYARYKQYLNAHEEPLPFQNKAVIILTNYRSGSSFFGELFNQHPDAFYSFENLIPLSNSSECSRHTTLKLSVIKDLIRCQLPDWINIYKEIPFSEQVKKNRNVLQCMRTKMCFRHNIKEMCEDRHCPRNATTSKKKFDCATECGTLNPVLVNNDCRGKKMVVLKIIRLCDILLLENIFKTSAVDIKILHLIRDPRATANSRQLITRKINLKDSMSNNCRRQSHNMINAIINTPDWLKGRYKVFRYEDTALFPYEVAQSVYEFVGLSFPESMKKWIANNTNIEIPTNDDSTNLPDSNENIKERQKRGIVPKKLVTLKKAVANPYGTKRNSTRTVQKWASRLPYSTVIFIENICAHVMKMAGYKKVGSFEQYKVKDNTTYFTDEIEILKHIKVT